jgi:hypothetical protein
MPERCVAIRSGYSGFVWPWRRLVDGVLFSMRVLLQKKALESFLSRSWRWWE